ncbi:hypothetical protein FOA52_009106 [Chlamydomonas sp. UWO 241]|nr:hypothetical protein FOA52_009106 [Chlamydomonas sp. UWO 241]
MEGAGDDGSGLGGGGDAGDALPVAVATLLHPAAVMAYEEGLKAALNAGADARRRSKEAKEKAFEDALSRLALYCRGAEALEAGSDASTATAVLRHVTKTTGGECMDLIYRWAWIEYLPEDEMPAEGSPVSAADAKKVAKASPRDVAEALAAAADALASQEAGSVSDAVERAALGVGLRLRGKRDKAHTHETPKAKEVKAAVAELRTRLSLQLQAEAEPASCRAQAEPAAALALALPLLFARATGCALSAPGKAMAGVLAFVRAGGSVPEPELAVFEAFHAGVVDALKGGNGGDDLVARLPELRAAAAGTLGSSGGEGGEGGQEAGGV